MTSRQPGYSRAIPRRAVRVAALALVVAASAAVVPSPAAAEAVATVVCWERLINDWYDGRIDQAYPVRCYRAAIANLPEDVEVYSSAREDIRRALLVAIRSSEKTTNKKVTESTRVKPPAKRQTNAPGNEPTGPGARDPDDEGQPGDLVAVGSPDGTDSVPLPLIVLAALAMLLLAAAGAGLVTRRLQARKAPGADEPPPVE